MFIINLYRGNWKYDFWTQFNPSFYCYNIIVLYSRIIRLISSTYTYEILLKLYFLLVIVPEKFPRFPTHEMQCNCTSYILLRRYSTVGYYINIILKRSLNVGYKRDPMETNKTRRVGRNIFLYKRYRLKSFLRI